MVDYPVRRVGVQGPTVIPAESVLVAERCVEAVGGRIVVVSVVHVAIAIRPIGQIADGERGVRPIPPVRPVACVAEFAAVRIPIVKGVVPTRIIRLVLEPRVCRGIGDAGGDATAQAES
jgi:hypothetical protein